MNKNICIAGKNNIAVDVTNYILKTYPDCTICSIINKTDDGTNKWQQSYATFCKRKGIQIVQLEDVYDIPDLIFISLEFDRLIVPSRFTSSELFNIHFSLLPEYKGMYTSALPILHQKKESGVTFHRIDKGIDTGDIIDQKKIPLDTTETAKSLYSKYIKNGTELVIKNLNAVITGTYKATPQPSLHATYYSKKVINYAQLEIDLKSCACQIDSQIRAFTFREYQIPQVNGIKVITTRITPNKSTLSPGTIVDSTDSHITVATIDYDIELYKDCLNQVLTYCAEGKLDDLKEMPMLSSYINDAETTHGWTPLMVAAYNYHPAICKFLIEKGADINARNYNGTTVLMYAKDAALQHQDFAYMNLFLDSGADKNAADYAGLTLSDYLENQSHSLKQYLEI